MVALESKSLEVLTETLVAEEVHLGHLGVEEVGDGFLGGFHGDVADVEATRLTGERADRRSWADGAGGRAEEEGRVVSERAGNDAGGARLAWKVEHAWGKEGQ